MKKEIIIDSDKFTVEDVYNVAVNNFNVILSQNIKNSINKGRMVVDKILVKNIPSYGINTGLGDNYKVTIPSEFLKKMQYNFIKSHACGVGNPLEKQHVRAVIFVMILNFSHGYSGISLETIEALTALLNKNITPYVPQDGSVGYLSFQAHISLVLIGSGKILLDNNVIAEPKSILNDKSFIPIQLKEKEGISLLNGSVDMTALAALAVYKASNLLLHADIISMLSFKSLRGNKSAFNSKISELKKHKGLNITINNIKYLLDEYSLEPKVLQDALSLRSIPQVHGASKDAYYHVKEIVEIELNSITDNPLVYEEDNDIKVISSANPHGQSIALVMDYLAIALSEIGNISERRTYRLVTSYLSDLPPFLIESSGHNTGFMIAQYVSADLVAKNKVLSHPASVDSIPTSAGQEDHISMGTHAAQKTLKIIENLTFILSIEWLTAAQAFDFMKEDNSDIEPDLSHTILRKHITKMTEDREMYIDIHKLYSIIKNHKIKSYLEQKFLIDTNDLTIKRFI